METVNSVKVEMVKESISNVESINVNGMETKDVKVVENNQNEVESLNNNDMETKSASQTTEVSKQATVEAARDILVEKKQWLAENSNADENVIKIAKVNITKAENNYIAALQAVELPCTTVEFWDVKESTEELEIITKKKAEIIIATSDYSMAVNKVNIELGKKLINNKNFEKAPLFVTDAKLFYETDIVLKDLNGNVVPKDTPNVYVPIDSANGYWQWKTYHESNINAIVKEEKQLIIENVKIKKFASLQEFAQYRGVNNVLSRGFNGLEKAGNAALATQHEFYQRIFSKARELKANISVITKYYNQGKTLNLKVWNNATLGMVEESFSYDLTIGDKIITTLQEMKFKAKTIKERYMIDAITLMANYAPQGKEKIGIEEVISTIKSLNKENIAIIESCSMDKVNSIQNELLTQCLKNRNEINQAA